MFADRMTSLGMIAAGAVHEIANPLAMIVVNIDLVRRALERVSQLAVSVAGSEGKELALAASDGLDAAADALAGARHAGAMLGDLRSFSRPGEEEHVPVEVRSIVDRAVRLVSPDLRRSMQVTTEFREAPRVLGSERLLTQVFVDLLVNAAHATATSPGPDKLVAMAVWEAGGEAVVEVRDTGTGIPAALLPRIFEPFFTTKPPGAGTGLGLWICRKIVAAHGGRIEVDSAPGLGTRVRVRLPAHAGDGERGVEERGRRESSAEP